MITAAGAQSNRQASIASRMPRDSQARDPHSDEASTIIRGVFRRTDEVGALKFVLIDSLIWLSCDFCSVSHVRDTKALDTSPAWHTVHRSGVAFSGKMLRQIQGFGTQL